MVGQVLPQRADRRPPHGVEHGYPSVRVYEVKRCGQGQQEIDCPEERGITAREQGDEHRQQHDVVMLPDVVVDQKESGDPQCDVNHYVWAAVE